MPLDPQVELRRLREDYEQDHSAAKRNFLIYGDFGTGKTVTACTLPPPILAISFDPGGFNSKLLKPKIESGDIIVVRFEKEDGKNPTEWDRFATQYKKWKETGFFAPSSPIRSIVLDSLTSVADAIMNAIAKKAGRAGAQPQLQDYQIQQIILRDLLKDLNGLPMNVAVTGHIKIEKDETLGKIVSSLLVSGKLDTKIPLLFDEVFVARSKTTAQGEVYELQTQNDGFYKARTRTGSGIFEKFEKPDLFYLLKKAGVVTA